MRFFCIIVMFVSVSFALISCESTQVKDPTSGGLVYVPQKKKGAAYLEYTQRGSKVFLMNVVKFLKEKGTGVYYFAWDKKNPDKNVKVILSIALTDGMALKAVIRGKGLTVIKNEDDSANPGTLIVDVDDINAPDAFYFHKSAKATKKTAILVIKQGSKIDPSQFDNSLLPDK